MKNENKLIHELYERFGRTGSKDSGAPWSVIRFEEVMETARREFGAAALMDASDCADYPELAEALRVRAERLKTGDI